MDVEQWIPRIQSLWENSSLGQYAKSLELGKEFVEEVPSSLKSLLYITLAESSLGANQIAKAFEYAQKAREAFVDGESLYIDEMTLLISENLPYYYQGEMKKFRDQLQSQNLGESHSAMLYLASSNYWSGNFSEAIRQYEEALLQCSGNENLQDAMRECLLGQVRCHLCMYNVSDAKEIILELFQRDRDALDDSSPESMICAAGEYAYLKAMEGKIPEARMVFHMNLKPKNIQHPYKKAHAYYYRALLRYEAGALYGAVEDLENLVKLPIRKFEKIKAYATLSEIYCLLGKTKELSKCYQEIAAFPEIFLAEDVQEKLEGIPEEKQVETALKAEETALAPVKAAPAQKQVVSTTPEAVEPPIEAAEPPTEAAEPPIGTPAVEHKEKETYETEEIVDETEEALEQIPFAAVLLGLENYIKSA